MHVTNYFKVDTQVFPFNDNDVQDTRRAWQDALDSINDPEQIIAAWRVVPVDGTWNYNLAYVGHRRTAEILSDINEGERYIFELQETNTHLAFLTQPLRDLENRRAELSAHPLYHGEHARSAD